MKPWRKQVQTTRTGPGEGFIDREKLPKWTAVNGVEYDLSRAEALSPVPGGWQCYFGHGAIRVFVPNESLPASVIQMLAQATP